MVFFSSFVFILKSIEAWGVGGGGGDGRGARLDAGAGRDPISLIRSTA